MARCEDSCPVDSRVNGKCRDLDPGDNLLVQCVGDWAQAKHDVLGRYIEATSGPRNKFLNPPPGVAAGGAAFIDLFSGPGRARVRSTGALIDGSPLIALKHDKAPFTKLIFCELDADNAAAIRARSKSEGDRVIVIEGDCHANIDKVIAETPPNGLNFALVDPFGLDQHDFDTFAKLAKVHRMDLLIHFPTMDAKRNFNQGTEPKLTKALGTADWRKDVRKPKDVTRAIDTLHKGLVQFGYTGENVRSVPVTNSHDGVLYHLVYASKDRLGDKIWESIARTRGNQRSLPGF